MVRWSEAINTVRGRPLDKRNSLALVHPGPPVLGRPFTRLFKKMPRWALLSEGVYVITRPNCVGTKAMHKAMRDSGIEFCWVLAACSDDADGATTVLSGADRCVMATLVQPFDKSLPTPTGMMLGRHLEVVRYSYLYDINVWQAFVQSCRVARMLN